MTANDSLIIFLFLYIIGIDKFLIPRMASAGLGRDASRPESSGLVLDSQTSYSPK